MAGQPGFFDADERLRGLSASGDPLERLRAVVDLPTTMRAASPPMPPPVPSTATI
jgi:hypothetical protein